MLKRTLLLLTIFALSTATLVQGQGIRGKVVDFEGNPVGYASIFIKELSRGTTSNSLGLFSLPLPEGEYHIFFRSLGYTEVSKTIQVTTGFVELEITMPPQTYMIPEVRVSAKGEDPAYHVMRKAIGLAHYHLNQVSTYDAEIYIKGTAYFNKLPRAIAKRIEVGDMRVEENKAYMLESVNEVTYRAPDKYDMKVIASQNTIPGSVEQVNPMDYINASLYEPQIEGFISPLARNAFFYYRFTFEGSFLQGSYLVDKIKVTPKRKSQNLCRGYLYIVEDLWCLHSSDLEVNTIAGTLYLQQQYANIIMDAWLPVSHKLQMEVEVAGVEAEVTYVSSLQYKKTVLNANLPRSFFEPTNKPSPGEQEAQEAPDPPSEEQQKIQEILEKDDINDRDMAKLNKLLEKETEKSDSSSNKLLIEGTKFSIARNAVTTDSSFWNSIRPVPLTTEEIVTITQRDSILGTGGPRKEVVRDSTARRQPRKQKIRGRDLVYGKLFQSANRKTKIRYGGLLDFSMLNFNTVDGWVYGQDISYDYRPDRVHVYRANLKAGYAFQRKAPDLKFTSSILYGPKIRGKIALRASYASYDFNGTMGAAGVTEPLGIPPLTNAAYSLLYRENYSKRYELKALQLEHRMDLATGLVFYATAEVQERGELTNNSDLSLFYRDSKTYTANHPSAYLEDDPLFDDLKLLYGQVTLEYTHDYYYRLRNGRKQYRNSDYPTLFAIYKQAFPVDNSWADYNLLRLGLRHVREVGLLSELDYIAEGGYYFTRNRMHFADYTHFKASPTLLDISGFDRSYQLLNHYEASTGDYFINAGVKLTSPYIAVKMLPWFSERLWNESLSVNYLYTPETPHHIQLGYSLNEIGFLVDVGLFTAFENWQYRGSGIRVNLRFQ